MEKLKGIKEITKLLKQRDERLKLISLERVKEMAVHSQVVFPVV